MFLRARTTQKNLLVDGRSHAFLHLSSMCIAVKSEKRFFCTNKLAAFLALIGPRKTMLFAKICVDHLLTSIAGIESWRIKADRLVLQYFVVG